MTSTKTNYEFGFDKIIVIESLPVGEKRTGKELSNSLNYLNIDLDIVYYFVSNREELLMILDSLIKVTKNGNVPFLHFEMHGSDEFDGLFLKNEDLIKWELLAKKLRSLNKRTNNNLFLSFATCYGSHMYQEILPSKYSPCYGFIGTWEKLYEDEILFGFESFFKTLLTRNLTEAIAKLNQYSKAKCDIYFADEIFERIFKNYFRTELTRKKSSEWKYDMIRQFILKYNKLPSREQVKFIEREGKNLIKQKIIYKRIFNHKESEILNPINFPYLNYIV